MVELPSQGRRSPIDRAGRAAVDNGTSETATGVQGGYSISVAGGLSFGVAYSSPRHITTIRRTMPELRAASRTR